LPVRTKVLFTIAALVIVGLFVGGAAFGSGSSRITSAEKLRVHARFTNFKNVDNERPKESPGDELLLRAKLSKGGSRVGVLSIRCTRMFYGHLQCVAIAGIEGRGKLVAEGAFRDAPRLDTSMAVTGGTGDFRNARGVLEVDSGPNGSTFTYHLIP
jgi:hypothetical protein